MRVWLEASLQAGSEAASLQGGSEAATLVFASPGLQAPSDTPVDLRSCQHNEMKEKSELLKIGAGPSGLAERGRCWPAEPGGRAGGAGPRTTTIPEPWCITDALGRRVTDAPTRH